MQVAFGVFAWVFLRISSRTPQNRTYRPGDRGGFGWETEPTGEERVSLFFGFTINRPGDGNKFA